MILHVTNAEYINDYRLRICFNDGVEGIVDLKAELCGEMFEPLRDLKTFQSFRVDPELETILWPNGADLAPEFLYDHLVPDKA